MKENFKVSAHIAWRKVEDEVVALDLDSSLYYSFNETGARLWELLAEGSSLEEAVQGVVDEFDGAPKAVEKDARDFVKDLCRDKLIEAA